MKMHFTYSTIQFVRASNIMPGLLQTQAPLPASVHLPFLHYGPFQFSLLTLSCTPFIYLPADLHLGLFSSVTISCIVISILLLSILFVCPYHLSLDLSIPSNIGCSSSFSQIHSFLILNIFITPTLLLKNDTSHL